MVMVVTLQWTGQKFFTGSIVVRKAVMSSSIGTRQLNCLPGLNNTDTAKLVHMYKEITIDHDRLPPTCDSVKHIFKVIYQNSDSRSL